MWTSLHTRLAAETHLTDEEFVQVAQNSDYYYYYYYYYYYDDDDDNEDDYKSY
jgi:hypothetical protein